VNRKIETDLETILDLVNCAEDYGFRDDVLFTVFRDMTGWVTDEEIKAYADRFLTPEFRAQRYSEEDAESSTLRLTEWRDRYCKNPAADQGGAG